MANPQKENGHIDIANEIVEELAKIHLSGYENRILWAIFRKTYGWHKKEDWITNSQIAEMTGIADSHVSRTIKILIKRNIVTKNSKKLGFQKDYDQWEKLPKGVTSHHKKKLPKGVIKLPKGVIEVTKGGIKSIPKGVYTKEIKETTTKEIIQKKERMPINLFREEEKKENTLLINNEEKEKKKPNNIEFDFEMWSWHGIDDDIMDRWAKIFPNVEISLELIKMREFFKSHPGHEKMIKEKFRDNYANYIFDWLERAKRYKEKDKIIIEEGG